MKHEEIGLLLGPAYHQFRGYLDQHLANAGLQGIIEIGMGPLIFLLDTHGEQPIHFLVEHSGFTKGTVTNQLKVMHQRELIIRRPDKNDGRVIRVRLSAKGKRCLKKLQEIRASIDEHFRSVLGKDYQAGVRVLQKLQGIDLPENAPEKFHNTYNSPRGPR